MYDEPSWVVFVVGGTLGALTNAALGSRTVLLPRVEGDRVHLGFLGQLVVCVGVACVVDHDFQTAFFSSLCGTSLLRCIKNHIERRFRELEEELGEHDE